MHEARMNAPIIMTVVTTFKTVLKSNLEYKYVHKNVIGTVLTMFIAIVRLT